MRWVLVLLVLLVACVISPTSRLENIHVEGILADLNRIDMDTKGYRIRVWVIPIPGLDTVEMVQVESISGEWFTPIYTTSIGRVLIPAQTNISVYSKYIVTGTASP